MKYQFIALLSCTLLFSCGNKASNQQPTAAGEPVETEKRNTNLKPAFAGQTRAPGIKTTSSYTHKIVTDNLDKPWGIATLPDGRFLITEKKGKIRIVNSAGNVSEPISGVPEVNSSGQGGLLGITTDPDFATNRMIYWSFSHRDDKGNLTAVAKGRLSADEKSLENVQVIFRALPYYDGNLHYGSRVIFDRTGHLLVSTGERSDKVTRPQAQWLNSALGKILRITTDGKPAADNPFLGTSEAMPEIYSYGHRNVQGLAIHPQTGEIWENEFGPRGGDEVNLIKPGKNYGWPIITYGIEYSGGTIGDGIGQKQGLEQPVYYWDPVTSPSGMTFYASPKIPEWNNNLFIAALSDTHITRLVIENGRVTGEERLLDDEDQRFRDITQGKDGALYAITDQGRLYRIGK